MSLLSSELSLEKQIAKPLLGLPRPWVTAPSQRGSDILTLSPASFPWLCLCYNQERLLVCQTREDNRVCVCVCLLGVTRKDQKESTYSFSVRDYAWEDNWENQNNMVQCIQNDKIASFRLPCVCSRAHFISDPCGIRKERMHVEWTFKRGGWHGLRETKK